MCPSVLAGRFVLETRRYANAAIREDYDPAMAAASIPIRSAPG
jgi:hypothetical protein